MHRPDVGPANFFRRPVGAIFADQLFSEPLEPSLSWRWISFAVFAPGRASTWHRGGRGCHRRFRPGAGTSTVPAGEGAPKIQVGEQQHKTCPTAHGFARGTKANPRAPGMATGGATTLVMAVTNSSFGTKKCQVGKSAGKTHPL